MKARTWSPSIEAALWLRILHPEGEIRPSVAHVLVDLALPDTAKDRAGQLSAKARLGTLSVEEDLEMEHLERAAALLSTLKSRARQVLRHAPETD